MLLTSHRYVKDGFWLWCLDALATAILTCEWSPHFRHQESTDCVLFRPAVLHLALYLLLSISHAYIQAIKTSQVSLATPAYLYCFFYHHTSIQYISSISSFSGCWSQILRDHRHSFVRGTKNLWKWNGNLCFVTKHKFPVKSQNTVNISIILNMTQVIFICCSRLLFSYLVIVLGRLHSPAIIWYKYELLF